MIHNTDVGGTLRRLRGKRSQTSVARKAGISRQTLSRCEQGRQRPSKRNLESLLEALGADRATFESTLLEVWETRLAQEEPGSPAAHAHRLRTHAAGLIYHLSGLLALTSKTGE